MLHMDVNVDIDADVDIETILVCCSKNGGGGVWGKSQNINKWSLDLQNWK